MMKTKLILFVTVLAAALFLGGCATTETSSDPLKNGLVAYFPFNGNAKDESGNGNDGEVKGATLTKDRHRNVNAAYEFAVSNSHINIPESDTLKPKRLTLNTWVYLSKDGIDEPWHIMGIHGSSQWAIDNTRKFGGKNFFGFYLKGATWANVEYNGRIPVEEWFMYTATYDGLEMKQYLNSKEICSLSFPGHQILYGADGEKPYGHIGGRHGETRNNVTCKLDDARIYNRALSAAEVKALYDLEKPKVQ
jgi:hypothetical protein